jgi:hypothetical protein
LHPGGEEAPPSSGFRRSLSIILSEPSYRFALAFNANRVARAALSRYFPSHADGIFQLIGGLKGIFRALIGDFKWRHLLLFLEFNLSRIISRRDCPVKIVPSNEGPLPLSLPSPACHNQQTSTHYPTDHSS